MCINRSLFWKNEIIEITIFQQSMLHYTFEHLKKEKNPRILIFSRKEIFHLIENTRWILTWDVRNLASAITWLMSVGTLIYSQTPRNLMIDSITKGSRPLFVTNRLYITREGEGEEKGEGRCFINFIFRPKCYFLAARKGVRSRHGGEEKGGKREEKGNGSPRATWYKSRCAFALRNLWYVL